MSAVRHHQSDIVSRGLHHPGNECMTEAVAREAIRLPIVNVCKLGSLTARACNRIIEGLGFRSRKEILVVRQVFVDAPLDHVTDAIPNWQVALVFGLCGAERDDSF